ncbi:MAG: hypothetical protein HYZ75_14785 [Elusimicrobia bacterium]|nr:hypothetical protein [Elusimicrobiota bacterium]
MKSRYGDPMMGHDPAGRTKGVAGKPSAKGGVCPACKATVPAKAGFRFSSLKCPKCGAMMGK